jgi:hypothetical protein
VGIVRRRGGGCTRARGAAWPNGEGAPGPLRPEHEHGWAAEVEEAAARDLGRWRRRAPKPGEGHRGPAGRRRSGIWLGRQRAAQPWSGARGMAHKHETCPDMVKTLGEKERGAGRTNYWALFLRARGGLMKINGSLKLTC